MTTDWKDVESKYYMFVVRRQPVVIVKGDGTRVWDVDGKEYLDFTSGWAVNNAGHANKAIADAISEQARTLLQDVQPVLHDSAAPACGDTGRELGAGQGLLLQQWS